MQKTILFILCITSLFFYACEEITESPSDSEEQELLIKVVIPEIASDKKEYSILFTGDDILWFNATTKEIRFKNNNSQWDIIYPYYHEEIYFYIDDEELFSCRICSAIDSRVFSNLVLYYTMDGRFCLQDGYPDVSVLQSPEANQQLRDENMKEIEEGWNTFMDLLKKKGKYKGN